MFIRIIALLMSLSLTLSAVAQAQAPVTGQATQMQSLQEELRQMRQIMEQMRQLIERQEARINRLEEEKSASAAKPASATGEAPPTASKDSSPAAPSGNQADNQTKSEATANADDSTQEQKSTPSKAKTPTPYIIVREVLDFWRDTTVNWFLFLPFYHFGFRVAYPFNEKFTATYWLVNGINQSEDFNPWKSQAALLTFKPTSRITAQANYYSGREQRVRMHSRAIM